MLYKLITFLILLLAAPAWGATYYLRQDGTAANKGAATSPSAAATSMSVSTFNAETFSAGDVILLSSQGGVITSRISPPSSGESGNPITISNVVGETPTISVRDIVTDFSVHSGSVYKATYAHAADAVFQDNLPLQKHSSADLSAGQFYSDESDLYIYGDPAGTVITASQGYYVGAGFYLNNKSYITIKKSATSGGILLKYNAIGVYSTASTANVAGIVIDGLSFEYCYDSLLSLTLSNSYSTAGQFINNTAYRCNSMMRAYSEYGTKYTGSNSWTISSNTGTEIGTTDGTSGWSSNAAVDREVIGLQNSQTTVISSNNSTGGNAIFAIIYTLDGAESNSTEIYKNTCLQNNNRFLILSGEGTWTNNGIKFFNNIHSDDYALTTLDANHASLYLDKPASVTTGTKIYNNTIIGSEFSIYMYSGAAGGATGYDLKNNIFVGASNYTFFVNNEVPLLSWTSDYNIYDWSDSLPFFYNDGAYSLANFVIETSQDAHSLAVDPKIDSSTFGPAGNSPAKDAGAVLYTYAAHPGDFLGAKVYGSAPDIGAIEYKDHTFGGWFFEMFIPTIFNLCASTNANCYIQP